MRSFGTRITSAVVVGLFTLSAVAHPQHRHGSWSGAVPSPVGAGPAPASASEAPAPQATSTSSTGTSDKEVTTSSTPSTSNQNTGSDTSGTDTSTSGSGSGGQATIVNKCTFPTYLTVCIQHPASCGSTHTLAANIGTYSESYGPESDGGHSLKISVTQGSGNILQFEYTNEGNGDISYDLSEVNGNPFGQWGFSLTNTSATAHCAPPANSCPAIFTDPTNGIPYTAPTSEGTGAILCG